MTQLTQFIFTLYPHESTGPFFLKPYAYIFRGIFMDWLKQYNATIGNLLHQKQPKDSPLFVLDYALQQKLHYPQQLNRRSGNNRFRSSTNSTGSRNSKVEKITYIISSLNDNISRTLLDFILQQKESTIQYAMQKAVITQVEIKQKSLKDLVQSATIIPSLSVKFLSPTAFSIRGRNSTMRFPLPEYFFPNLAKLWDSVFAGTEMAVPTEFFEWVSKNVSVSSYQMKTHAWSMGKNVKFAGAMGWIKYLNEDVENPMGKWLDILTRFGEDMNTGNGRTAGFGHFRRYRERKQ
ncbi:MAG: CRISPR system precrRNA processing endoribonuclease RAMP protein Cas6 [Promethearchaeota archaeon]